MRRKWPAKRKKSSVRPACFHPARRFALTGCATLLLLLFQCWSFAAAAAFVEPAAQKQVATPDYALIVGTVWGPDDRPVAGIPIKIRRATDKKARWELVSDNRGEFAQRVPPGAEDYIIQADIKTPKGQPKPAITVTIEDNERKDVGLHLTELFSSKK